MPGAIDFSAMYRRCGLSRANGDIVLQIEAIVDPIAKAEAYRIIVEEEMIGVDNMELREDMYRVLKALHSKRIRTAIATRNCDVALNKFLEALDIESHRLHLFSYSYCLISFVLWYREYCCWVYMLRHG